ncbi:membrane protein [Rossellomorea marisflavi]|uniref:Membrane protein n=1 Tax=Rossellomorea marisflavi TaxID=189381 RepID=A0A0M0G0R5_9BACI|nr:DUF421 domain-containing protein [Rossellomorea marisflavi]KON83405.1 membrane protein [Rossellomorea marisflavi]MDR4938768.1 DUF421 domain-containing protein [Rossellomorea marisflavi]
MEPALIWQTLIIFVAATLLLRISGRRTISQMTIPQTVMMIAIGTLLIQPVSGKGLWTTFGIAGILVISLILTEYIQFKFDPVETAISGKALVVIENGILNEKNLKKLRLPVDKLEQRLRQVGVTSHKDVQYATIESNGQLGYNLRPEKQPATKEDIQNLLQALQSRQTSLPKEGTTHNIFQEVVSEGEANHVPKYLQ